MKSILSPSVWNRTQKLLSDGWIFSSDHHQGYQLYLCPACGHVQTRYRFALRCLERKTYWQPAYICGNCRKRLVCYTEETTFGDTRFLPVSRTPLYRCEHCGELFAAPGQITEILWD